MLRNLAALVSGVIFGLGLAISGMANPLKVLGFLDVAGDWDPSLALVMAGALSMTFIGYRLAYGRGKPLLAESFGAPAPGVQGPIDARLVLGALIFGVGWGLVGFCPGPAIASLAYGRVESFVFVIAMAAGAAIQHLRPGSVAIPER